MNKQADHFMQSLAGIGLNDTQADQIRAAYESTLPSKAYTLAVLFLGLATLLVVIGLVVLLALEKQVGEAFYGIGGMIVGGLAGIVAQIKL
jgi:hypothetical protein